MTTSKSVRISVTLALGFAVPAIAGSAAAVDAPTPKVTADGATTMLQAFAHETKADFGGSGPTAAPKPGDKYEFADDLSQGGVKIGSDSVHCTVIGPMKLDCESVTTFNDGTLVVKGTAPMGMTDNTVFDVPIVSGTGAYQGATGTFHLASLAGTHGADADLTFTYSTAAKAATAAATPAAATATATPATTSAATSAATKPATSAATKPPTSQVSEVPAGGAETGGGSTAGVEHGWLFGLGALAAAAGAGTLVLGRGRA